MITTAGQVIAQDLNDEDEFLDTPEGPAAMDNTFMGYTIAVGHFNDDSVPGDICTSKSVDIYSYCTYFYLQM